jgi:hypothetical protein
MTPGDGNRLLALDPSETGSGFDDPAIDARARRIWTDMHARVARAHRARRIRRAAELALAFTTGAAIAVLTLTVL